MNRYAKALPIPVIDLIYHPCPDDPHTHESHPLTPSTSTTPPFKNHTKQRRILDYLKDCHCHDAKYADNSFIFH